MTIGNIIQGFQFRITEVTGNSFNANTQQNIKKRIENIIYVEAPPADAVKLAYVGSKEITPDNNLFLGDRSDSLYENSRVGSTQEFIGTAQPIAVNNKNFIVTQRFSEADSGNIPLYYKYEIQTDYSSIIADSFDVFDKDFNQVSPDKFKVVLGKEYNEDTGVPVEPAAYTKYTVYNNLEGSYDSTSGEYEVYFIQYTAVDSTTGKDITITELMDNKIAYREATFDDLWWVTGEVKPWVDAYIWSSDQMTVKLPGSGEFSVRYIERSRLKVIDPVGLEDTSPWFLRVVNGSFNTGYDGEAIRYHIPEFENQLFNPIEPYKLGADVTCLKIDDRFVKLPHDNIQSGSLFSYLYLTAANDGVVEYAITSDPYKDGEEYKDIDNKRVYDSNGDAITWSYSNFLGIDSYSGIVNVGFNVSDQHELKAVYSYEEEHFEITSLNMNPIFDNEAHKELRAIYLVPESATNENLGTQTESIRWVKVSPSGVVLNTNQDSIGNNQSLALDVVLATTDDYSINGILGLHYSWSATTSVLTTQEVIINGVITVSSASSFPRTGWIRFIDTDNTYRYAKYIDKTDTGLLLSSETTEVPDTVAGIFIPAGNTIELVNFLDERTTLTTRSADTENNYVTSGATPVSHSRYLMLVETTINPPHSIDESVKIDLREDGGGIDPDKYDEAKALQPEIQWMNNFGDFRGQLHPGNATMVVKVRADLLERFTEIDIERIVNENVPLGVKPLIRYYGYEPEIVSVIPSGLGFGEDKFGDHHFGE